MASTYSLTNPRAAALFRVMTAKAGITAEYIEGGILQNPLQIPLANKAIKDCLVAVKRELKTITAPPIPDIDDTAFQKTEGIPEPIPGKELLFGLYNELIVTLNKAYSAIQSTNSHTNRVVNNLIDLCGLAQSYTQSVQKLGIGVPLKTRANLSSLPQVPNISNASNNINLGGADGIDLPALGFGNITMPEILTQFSELSFPTYADTSEQAYGPGYQDTIKTPDNSLDLDDYNMIIGLDELLANNGIPEGILPSDSILAEVNQGAHCSSLFKSILSEEYGGLIAPVITTMIEKVGLVGLNLQDAPTIRLVITDLMERSNTIEKVIKDEREMWGNDVLLPPTFPSGKVLKIIYQVSRCESVVNLSTEEDVQGILFSCITPLALEILRSK